MTRATHDSVWQLAARRLIEEHPDRFDQLVEEERAHKVAALEWDQEIRRKLERARTKV